MADPTTVNVALAIPTRGSDVGTWDTPVNSDFNAIDGYFGGVQTISTSNAPITLTSPSGAITPSGGPTQSQNAVLRFTGTLTTAVQITLPLPGYYVIENLTTGAFVLSFRSIGAGEVIGVDQGEVQHIYNDGTNVRFVNLGRVGHIEIWAGLTAMPAWVLACTKPPFLLNDGSIYNFSIYPYLGARLLSAFGGNGTTTFGVPDHRGRVALPYDGTGSRITTAGSGLAGQILGASLDLQAETLTSAQIPVITSTATQSISVNAPSAGNFVTAASIIGASAPGGGQVFTAGAASGGLIATNGTATGSNFISVNSNTGGGSHPNVQPSQVTGISVIRAA